MASSERVLSGGRSSFSQKCSLLSQFLKERGSFGDLSLGLTPNSATEHKGTMDLLPKIEKSGWTAAGDLSGSAENGQMIIFYAGQVIVFDEFPVEKAEKVMMLARESSVAFPSPYSAESATTAPACLHPSVLASDLPIARKNSLARFLEKRKDRVAANAPYQASKPPAKVDTPWLGLAPQ